MMLTGNNGVLIRAGEAKERTDEAQITENIALAYNSALIGKFIKTDKTFEEKMQEELEETYGEGNVAVTKEGERNIWCNNRR